MLFRESIFMTGFPGFIASRLVERLAGTRDAVFPAGRAAFCRKGDGGGRADRRGQGVPLESFVIVEGDITKPDLGIASRRPRDHQVETTQIFHLAAVYDLAVDKDLAVSRKSRGHKERQRPCTLDQESPPVQLHLDLLRRGKANRPDPRDRARARCRVFATITRRPNISPRWRSSS